MTAPRVALLAIEIYVPRDKYVLHKCHNQGCVRPDHLYLGDQSQNMKDAVAAGTHNMSSKTHCKYGHSYEEYGRINKNGARCCKLCDRRRWAEYRDRGWRRKEYRTGWPQKGK